MTDLHRIRAVRRPETLRHLGGSGNHFSPTWAMDGRQLLALCDGFGFEGPPYSFFNSALAAVDGEPDADPRIEHLAGYPEITGTGGYYGLGTLAVGRRIHQFLAIPRTTDAGVSFVGAKLIQSGDEGRTWTNQDGTSPVRWESPEEQSRDSLVFLDEPGGTFALPSILQMGRAYAANRDGFVYIYSPDGSTEGTMNRTVLCRVPVDLVPRREAYEFFAGFAADGSPSWAAEIADRAPVHVFPPGWVNRHGLAWAWHPSVTYSEPLGLYLLSSWGMGIDADGNWFARPSYLGIWVSEQPWGPWTQVLEDEAWAPDGDPAALCMTPVIPAKWIGDDGRSFWLAWTDNLPGLPKDEKEPLFEEMMAAIARRDFDAAHPVMTRLTPYYGLNTQRVDLEF